MHADNCTFVVLMHHWDAAVYIKATAAAAAPNACIHFALGDSGGVSLVDSFDVLCDYNEHLTDNCFQMHKVTRIFLLACWFSLCLCIN
jgi:hypothetical protein